MSCPTCDHTMSRLGCQYSECAGSWACPRCGTLKIGHEDGRFDIITPDLVARCRGFVDNLTASWSPTEEVMERLRKLGVLESINRPEDRPT